MYHTQSGNSSYYYSTMFSMGNGYRGYDEGELYSSASVDCTLSLGTPSTRGTNDDGNHHERKRSSCMSNFGWNILPSKNTAAPPSKPHRGGSSANPSSAGDPLLARRCANCDTTSTPLWRNGPRGPKSLCNACGIRYKKEERRATAAAASSSGATSGNAGYSETQYVMNGSWAPASQKGLACYSSSGYSSEYQVMEDAAADYSEMGGGGGAFMSWRFNVTDRPSFVHDFTR